ncbi:hypothetical protein SynBOUM118_00717 [Synechococcus sp. BOUM118]|nr:hypothetical protein SynBOUM118_00717 [Synechococcus sp. BOUM118]
MKTFSQFQEDSKGFGGEKAEKRKARKQNKYKSKWQMKVDKLKKSQGNHWSGLESVQDPRTPKRYFVPRTVPKGKRIVDDLSKGNEDSAVKMIKKELDMKISRKSGVKKSMLRAAIAMEQQLFGITK